LLHVMLDFARTCRLRWANHASRNRATETAK
jgi:hypothetical protein